MPTLAVVGAGPKGIAIAKARALAAAGLPAPRVVLVDPGDVAGNWTGHQGYTSGLLPLGTPPEKDVGYPYAASWGEASAGVVAAMGEYGWQRHLIRHGAYSDWVDRGRLRPTHRQWSAYLREVAGLGGGGDCPRRGDRPGAFRRRPVGGHAGGGGCDGRRRRGHYRRGAGHHGAGPAA